MSSETAERFMAALQQAEQRKDASPLVEFFGDDAELSNLAHRQQKHGREGAREFWEGYLAVFDRVSSEFTNVVVSDTGAALEWVARGTLAGGAPIDYEGVSVLETADGRVRRFKTYYDTAAFVAAGG